jgi:hypothetical protein
VVASQRHQHTYFNRLHLVLVAVLTVLTLALGLLGWALRPASGGFPSLESNMLVLLGSTVPGGAHPYVTQSLTRVSGGGTLLLQGDLEASPSVQWSVDLFHLDSGWRLCTPSAVIFGGGAISELKLSPQHVNLKPKFATDVPGFEKPVEVDGAGPFYLKLCWSVGGPVQANGAYLSSRFIPVYDSSAPVGLNQATPVYVSSASVSLTRELNLGVGTTADYSIQSVQPSSDYGGGWQWSGRPPAGAALAVSAVNASETQHDSYKAFLSGIVFGVAGGALVSLIMELVSPFRSRQERRQAEPGG